MARGNATRNNKADATSVSTSSSSLKVSCLRFLNNADLMKFQALLKTSIVRIAVGASTLILVTLEKLYENSIVSQYILFNTVQHSSHILEAILGIHTTENSQKFTFHHAQALALRTDPTVVALLSVVFRDS